MKRRKYPRKRKDLGKFKSPLEKSIYDKLVRIKNKDFNFQYEGEKLKYFTVHDYNPDITLTFPGGKKLYIEIKGFLRYEDQRKMRAVKNANPDADIRFIFTDRSRLGGATKMTLEQWCDKYGFPYTREGKVPKKWMSNSTSSPSSVKSASKPRSSRTSTETEINLTVEDSTVSSA